MVKHSRQLFGVKSAKLCSPPPTNLSACSTNRSEDQAMRWYLSNRADPEVRPLADRHYNRQKIGSPQFAPPGRCLVLKTIPVDAFWITSWPFAQYIKHQWAGAWVCSAFRNEGKHRSSELIIEAVKATLARWECPELGMITFVDTQKVRNKRDFGYCYLCAGFKKVGFTKGGLLALQLRSANMPTKELANP